ncbi:MerR family transcriptional regulator [Paenibacillus swuensis]|uniref:MerR family transcriptional regulator n=1 Tax=Paenibacillus swuensis TaxID=1178515 RepID=A0A172TG27_9BACL|nr:MerR family transcriptional regulator [Paenibacillus swuensis]ANE45854.1 MerR family transcriptional regulator [Paenibacillus swuensis]
MKIYYSIQEVSQILGISKDTLRYYDRIGIVSPARDDNRYRRYTKNDLINLMNIQIMQDADFTLDEIKGNFGTHRKENIDPVVCQEIAVFIEAKNAEISKKIAHLEKVSQLLDIAVETLRNFNHESDQRLKEYVRAMYPSVQKQNPKRSEEECGEDEG